MAVTRDVVANTRYGVTTSYRMSAANDVLVLIPGRVEGNPRIPYDMLPDEYKLITISAATRGGAATVAVEYTLDPNPSGARGGQWIDLPEGDALEVGGSNPNHSDVQVKLPATGLRLTASADVAVHVSYLVPILDDV